MTTTLLDDVLTLYARGFALIPVPYGQKRPVAPGWQDLRLDASGIRAAFQIPSNIGVLLGAPSAGLIDIDLDCPEAAALAPFLLPPTDLCSGRDSAPGSHWFYRASSPLKTTKYVDPLGATGDDRAMLVELRSTGTQTLVPPSVHPSGEPITWAQDGEPGTVDADVLQRAVAQVAAAAVLVRYWPAMGSRHEAALALGGGLLRAGWETQDTADFIWNIAQTAGDEEADDRRQAVLSTATALAAGEHATGWPTLVTLVDPRVVDAVRKWLGITSLEATNSYEVAKVQADSLSAGVPAEVRARSIPVPPFPLEIFPPVIARYLADGAETVGCPVDLIAVPFLGYAAAAIGRQRRLAVKRRWVRKATLWTGVVATSGSGKSPADGYARAALDILQTEADERFAEQVTAHKRELAQWKAADVSVRGDEPSPPLYEHWFTTDPTVESLAPMLQANPGVAAAFDELVAWARGCNAYKKGGNDRQKYLEIWNGRALKVDRRTQGVLFVPDPVCCLVGGIQPERLPELTREASVHDGLLPRFLWTYPDVPPRDWSWDERESDDLEAIVALFRHLRSSPPLTLRPHPAARVRWAARYDELRAQHASLPPLARELASKLPAHLATCWLVLQALHDPEGRRPEALPEHLDAAITLITYFQAHARRVLVHFGTEAPHVDAGLAGRVATILRGVDGWLAKTELWQALHRNATAGALDAALGALLAEGRVETTTEGTGPGQRILWRWIEPADADEVNTATTSPGWPDEPLATNSYESTNQGALNAATTSFDSYEVRDTTIGDRASDTPDSTNLYEVVSSHHSPPRPSQCFACGGTRFADDGVCLVCHPRPWAKGGTA